MDNSAAQLVSMLAPFFILNVPLIFLNGAIAKRKDREPMLYSGLSILPVVGVYLCVYLLSLPDRNVIAALAEIRAALQSRAPAQQQTPR
jgi:hypothetical protein